jgi:hypothetical protein
LSLQVDLNSSIIIRNATFQRNRATRGGLYSRGGAISVFESRAIIEDVMFLSNAVDGDALPEGGMTASV